MKAHQQRLRAPGLLRHTGILTPRGAAAALLIGLAALAAGRGWAVLLVVFFVAAIAVSKYRRDVKIQRAGAFMEKTGARDATQVLANGGVFAAASVLYAASGDPIWMAFAAGALGTASADTWATELGLLSRTRPRSIVSGKPVAPGTSGGVTLAGTLAGVLGALMVSATAYGLGWGTPGLAAIVGGAAGMTADSLLGAVAQERRWCPACDRATERRVHACGARTERRGGVRGLGNDLVNAMATLAGAAFAVLAFLLAR